ncbi:MAG: hypothetical protein BVN32_01540 [Proteobacteria bacterium ST_bin14]|nr:MAG: hypothetical protein BVN32_01540 [Proteobacteria bacterium ST_bin14]
MKIDVNAFNPAYATVIETAPPPELAHRSHESRSFEMPRGIWAVMFGAYAVFFLAMLAATRGDGGAVFVIVISAAYAAMYFGTATVLKTVGDTMPATPAATHDFETLTGRLSYGAGFAQILTVPLMIALFGVAIAIISLASA